MLGSLPAPAVGEPLGSARYQALERLDHTPHAPGSGAHGGGGGGGGGGGNGGGGGEAPDRVGHTSSPTSLHLPPSCSHHP